MIVYAFLYCPCIHESAFHTQSLHKSKRGAYKAMNAFINNVHMEWFNDRIKWGKSICSLDKATFDEAWKVIKKEVKE